MALLVASRGPNPDLEMLMERVLVAGLGVVSCRGSDLDRSWSDLLGASSRPAPVADPVWDTGARVAATARLAGVLS